MNNSHEKHTSVAASENSLHTDTTLLVSSAGVPPMQKKIEHSSNCRLSGSSADNSRISASVFVERRKV